MHYRLKRRTLTDESTIGDLKVGDVTVVTLEDGIREHKVYGETAISAGTYKLELRNVGGMTERYAKRYPGHRGMIWLREVPMFEWIYIHVGNFPGDTQGCILVGTHAGDNMIMHSRKAYLSIYDTIADAIEDGDCWLTVG